VLEFRRGVIPTHTKGCSWRSAVERLPIRGPGNCTPHGGTLMLNAKVTALIALSLLVGGTGLPTLVGLAIGAIVLVRRQPPLR
jgi:hypothetical protein